MKKSKENGIGKQGQNRASTGTREITSKQNRLRSGSWKKIEKCNDPDEGIEKKYMRFLVRRGGIMQRKRAGEG
ncbi:hypothetical protein AAC387_Pa02g4403 [Persea americana]